jgi:hypothetical protein
MLTLLSRPEGASIKLGFSLTSSKAADDVRRYRIERGAGADVAKASIDMAEPLARLSALTIFELRGEWRRLALTR